MAKGPQILIVNLDRESYEQFPQSGLPAWALALNATSEDGLEPTPAATEPPAADMTAEHDAGPWGSILADSASSEVA